MNLKALHTVIQTTMGWLDCHLWEFTFGDTRYGIPDGDRADSKTEQRPDLQPSFRPARLIFSTSMILVINWEHRIVVERISIAEADTKYPQFLGGERRCPPEDCGGPPGYFDFIENITSKRSKRAKETLEWYGGPYDPKDVDVEQVSITLGRMANSYRTGPSKPLKK